MNNIFGILLFTVLVSSTAADCSEGTRPHANPSGNVGASLATSWKVRTPNTSHVLVFLQDQGTITHKLFFVEFGTVGLPANSGLPASFVSASLAPGGTQLDCTDDKGTNWSFIIDGATSKGTKVTFGVKGLTEMNDPKGWDLTRAASFAGSGWDLVGLLQVMNPGTEPAPAAQNCNSGGPGATSCSQTINGGTCSTSCGSGYYACCYMNTAGSPRCPCVANEVKTK